MNDYFKEILKTRPFSFMVRMSSFLALFFIGLDFFNIPSTYIINQDIRFNLIIFSLGIIILMALMFELKVWSLFKIKSLNGIDLILCIVFLSSILYLISALVLQLISRYKLFLILIINIIDIVIARIRSKRYLNIIQKIKSEQTNIYDLKDIYLGNFELKENSMVLVSEKDVDYDLLEREDVINTLYSTIIFTKPDGRLVISVEGKWGSGKTTIINNVKRKLMDENKDILIIDEFDPWGFNNQESLFSNMFDIILKKSGYGHSGKNIKNTIKKFSETIFGKDKNWIIFKLFFENNDVSTLKSDINSYLRLCDKKVVFFIDNIDRIESKNVIMLFNSVANLLDFERITYVLSFDNERVKLIFDNELDMDYQYLKKIIQVQIRVPKIDASIMKKVYFRCINNLVEKLGYDKNDSSPYDLLVENLCREPLDIRDFKRFINSVISQPCIINTTLNLNDLLLIEYIKIHNNILYNEIFSKKRYFITYDKISTNDEIFVKDSRNDDRFYIESNEYFETLFSREEHKDYIEILARLFPNVKRFKDKKKDNFSRDEKTVQLNVVSMQHGICSAKYFELYFTKTTNDFLKIGESMRGFIDSINKEIPFSEKFSLFEKNISLIDKSNHKEFFERLYNYIGLLNENASFELSKILLNKIYSIDDSNEFLRLSARRRIIFIIFNLIKKIDEAQFNNIVEIIMSKYINIGIIRELDKLNNDFGLSGLRVEIINKKYKEMVEYIIQNEINIYQNEHYLRENIWSLCNVYSDNDNDIIKRYVGKIMNKENIYKIIYDCINVYEGTDYEYLISTGAINKITSIDIIDEVLNSVEPVTDDQKFILKVYNCFKNDKKVIVPEKRKIKDL